MEDELEDTENKSVYRLLHFANEIGYSIELVQDMAKLLISNKANSVLIENIRALMHVIKGYNETSSLIAKSSLKDVTLGHEESNEIIILSAVNGFTRMQERLPELENLAGLCSIEADNVIWKPAPTPDPKDNRQVIIVNLRDFQKQTGGHINLIRDLEQQLPGKEILLDPDRHGKNGSRTLKDALKEKGHEDLADKIHRRKVGDRYKVMCEVRIKLNE